MSTRSSRSKNPGTDHEVVVTPMGKGTKKKGRKVGKDSRECPECGVHVKNKNLARHLDQIHGLSPSRINKLMDGVEGRTISTDRGSRIGPSMMVPVISFLVVLVIVLSAYAIIPQGLDVLGLGSNDSDNDDNNSGGDHTPFTFDTVDGFEIHGNLYRSGKDKGTIIMVHGLQEKKEVWNDLANHEKERGFDVLTIDLRGHGESLYRNGSHVNLFDFQTEDFLAMKNDVKGAVKYADMMGLSSRICVIGASIGANIALHAAVEDSSIVGLVLLSPGVDYQGVRLENVMVGFSGHVLLMACNQDTAGRDGVDLLKYGMENVPEDRMVIELADNVGHGTQMLGADGYNAVGKIDLFLERVY